MWQPRRKNEPFMEWQVILAILASAALVLSLCFLSWIRFTSPGTTGLLIIGIGLSFFGSTAMLILLPLAAFRWLRGARFSLIELLLFCVIVSLILTEAYHAHFLPASRRRLGSLSSDSEVTPSVIFSMLVFQVSEPVWWPEYSGIVGVVFFLFCVAIMGALLLGALTRCPSVPSSLRLLLLTGGLSLGPLLPGPLTLLEFAIPSAFLLLVLGLRTTTPLAKPPVRNNPSEQSVSRIPLQELAPKIQARSVS